MYQVRRMKLDRSERLDQLAAVAGELYSCSVVSFWRSVRKGVWLKPSSMMRWRTDSRLHAHTADAVVEQFYAALKSWRKRRKTEPQAKPPRRRRRFARLQWKNTAIRLRGGNLVLSNGKLTPSLIIPWAFALPRMIEIGWDGKQYELRAVYGIEPTESVGGGDKVAGIDLGEIHLAVAHDGERTIITNGRYLRSLRRYQNKLKARLSAMLDIKKRGSRRRKKLARSKGRQLRAIARQINDTLHKQTTHLVSTLHEAGVQTVAIGDVRLIRQRTNLGKKANQKIHQWLAGKTRFMLTYKCERRGMNVILQDERYSSQTCPQCGRLTKARGRRYVCGYAPCGAIFHRDAVGSRNIREMYRGSYAFPVVGVHPLDASVSGGMASPTGVRFHPHLSRSSQHTASAV